MQDGRIRTTFPPKTKSEERRGRVCKLTEEVGELAGEVLAYEGKQRAEKLAARDKDALGDEVADVLICTLLLAESMGVDVDEALQRKIAKVDQRFADMEAQ